MKHNHARIMKVKAINVFQLMTARACYPFEQQELTIMIIKILTQPAVIHHKLVAIKKK